MTNNYMARAIDYKNHISELDTNRFGFMVARLDDWDVEPEEQLNEFKKLGVKLIISRVEGQNIELINSLEELGFRIKDNQLTYRFDIKNLGADTKELAKIYFVREVKQEDIPIIVKFTEDSFRGYGHYFADQRLDERKCLEIYKDWVQRSCLDKRVADKVFVAEINNIAAGFLTFKIFEKDNSKYAVGGLGAVSRCFRNKDVFRAITVHGLNWGAQINLEWEEHNVLTTNYSVNRSFTRLGFRIVNSYVTLHCWLV